MIGTGMTQYFMCGCVHVCAYVCMYMYVSAFITHSLCLHMSRSGSYHLIGKASCSLREIAKDRYLKQFLNYTFLCIKQWICIQYNIMFLNIHTVTLLCWISLIMYGISKYIFSFNASYVAMFTCYTKIVKLLFLMCITNVSKISSLWHLCTFYNTVTVQDQVVRVIWN